VNLPGLPQLSTDKTAWTPVQRKDLQFFWQEIARAIAQNAASASLVVGGGGSVPTIPAISYGTFTPTLAFGGASAGLTYASQFGNYELILTPVQSWVHGYGGIALSSKGTSTGNAVLAGFPFPCLTGNAALAFDIKALSGPIDVLIGSVMAGSATAPLLYGDLGAAIIANDTNFTATSVVNFMFQYRVS